MTYYFDSKIYVAKLYNKHRVVSPSAPLYPHYNVMYAGYNGKYPLGHSLIRETALCQAVTVTELPKEFASEQVKSVRILVFFSQLSK